MLGQAIITTGSNRWTVSVASTYAELLSGLSGQVSIPANTGMLFDMGVDQDHIDINTIGMLFDIDIVFINSEHGVVGMLHDVSPGEAALFDAGGGYGTRYFMEVNAGEAADVNVGDSVSISGDVQPSFWPALITAVMAISQIAIVGSSTYRVVRHEIKRAEKEPPPEKIR